MDGLPVVALIDVVIGCALLEGLLLWALHRFAGRGVPPREFAANLLSGLCLMVALRVAVTGGAAAWVAGWLLAAGLAHGSDILRRWRPPLRAGRPAPRPPGGPGTAPRSGPTA